LRPHRGCFGCNDSGRWLGVADSGSAGPHPLCNARHGCVTRASPNSVPIQEDRMTSASATTQTAPPGSQQVLTFVLGNETYGVDILRVQEIRGWAPVTKVPHAPPHVLGVLNLRGAIVPIVDLRMRFALERAEYTGVTVII